MPEPQRTAAVAIIVDVAKQAGLPPGYLTTHIDNRPDVAKAREDAQKRILLEVPGVNHSMLARAWGRDPRRMRALVNGDKKLNRPVGRAGIGVKRGGKFK